MSITPGQDIDASDFIDYDEKNATPATDTGKALKLEGDGKLHSFFIKHGAVVNAGETLNGATLPVPVYQNKTDNEVYACDANDNTRYKFIGFVTTNSTNGNPIVLQTSGIVGGFTGLDEGEKYYVQDAVGTIGTSPGTQEILVGVAISQTELFIQKGRRHANGVTSFSSTTTTAVTLGFRPSKITAFAVAGDGGTTNSISISSGGWTQFGGNMRSYQATREGVAPVQGSGTGAAWLVGSHPLDTNYHTGNITSITDTGFTLDNVKTGSPDTAYVTWFAEGEL